MISGETQLLINSTRIAGSVASSSALLRPDHVPSAATPNTMNPPSVFPKDRTVLTTRYLIFCVTVAPNGGVDFHSRWRVSTVWARSARTTSDNSVKASPRRAQNVIDFRFLRFVTRFNYHAEKPVTNCP